MDSKVFVARVNTEPYMEISSGGSFINPMTATFTLRDTREYKYVTQSYHVIIMNSIVGFLQLEAMGVIPGLDTKVAWVNTEENFATKINKEMNIDSTNKVTTIPFFVQFRVLDDLDISTRDQYANLVRIKMVWA